MPPRKQKSQLCQVCKASDSKYNCSQCVIAYCSVACFKEHKASSCHPNVGSSSNTTNEVSLQRVEVAPLHLGGEGDEVTFDVPTVLRPLTSLKWPYVPEESSYPDPLKRDDPKILQLPQYEAIATSPAIRTILEARPNLPALLVSIDKLRGRERDEALQRALGVTAPEVDDQLKSTELSEDVLALRELAEAIESAVRGGNSSAIGLNWGE